MAGGVIFAFAVLAAGLSTLWTVFVVFANVMKRAAAGPFVGAWTLWACWLLTAALFACWVVL